MALVVKTAAAAIRATSPNGTPLTSLRSRLACSASLRRNPLLWGGLFVSPCPSLLAGWPLTQQPFENPLKRAHRASGRAAFSRRLTTAFAVAEKKRIVFLGTPQECVAVLEGLLAARGTTAIPYEISAVVTQPPRERRRGRKRIVEETPVARCATAAGIPEDRIWWPEKANDQEFLDKLRDLQPHLCITAAYGNFLPQRFLDIPEYGTVNIHPSLLPLYRGAAPVQRAIEDGVEETGVSVAFTVLKMDAGPIIAAETKRIDDMVTTAELLPELFVKGTTLLIRHLDRVLLGEAATYAKPQDEDAVTHTAKLTFEEGLLLPQQTARSLHNKVRAFVGWPSTRIDVCLKEGESGSEEMTSLKVLESRVEEGGSSTIPQPVLLQNGTEAIAIEVEGTKKMKLRCLDGSLLELVRVQPGGKKAMDAHAFLNGLRGRSLFWPIVPVESQA